MILSKETVTAALLLLFLSLLLFMGVLMRIAYGIGFDRGYLKGQYSMLPELHSGEKWKEKKDDTI